MANKRYEDTPLTNFPSGEDNWSRMSDLSVAQLAVAKKYSEFYNNGDIVSANALLEQNPELKNALFTPAQWNKIRDAVIALQRFFLKDVDTMITTVAQNTIGINDSATGNAVNTNAYSVKKINEFFNEISKVRQITLSATGWTDTAPYTQKVTLADIKSTHNPGISVDDSQSKTNRKAQQKQLGKHVDRVDTYDGYLIFTCDESKPTIDIKLYVKGA